MIRRRTGYYNRGSLIIFSFFFFLFLLGLIGVNVLLQYSTNDFLLGLLIAILEYFSLYVNIFFVFMLFVFGIPFILAWRRYIIYMSPKNKISVPKVEEKILQILAENKGKFLSRLDLSRKVNFLGSFREFFTILNHLWEEDKIKRISEDFYYVD